MVDITLTEADQKPFIHFTFIPRLSNFIVQRSEKNMCERLIVYSVPGCGLFEQTEVLSCSAIRLLNTVVVRQELVLLGGNSEGGRQMSAVPPQSHISSSIYVPPSSSTPSLCGCAEPIMGEIFCPVCL